MAILFSVPKGGQPSVGLQSTGMWCIIISIGCEYFFLIVNVIYIIKTLIAKKKNPELSKKDDIEDFMVYKWVRKSYLKNNKVVYKFEDVAQKDDHNI